MIFSAFSIAIPAIIGLSIAINWQAVFFLMHRVLFRNTYWFFDPETDPVILILPSEFFMHCGVMIVCLILLFAAVSFGIYWVMRRRLRKKKTDHKSFGRTETGGKAAGFCFLRKSDKKNGAEISAPLFL